MQESLQELPTNKALNLGMPWDALPYQTDSAFHEAWAHKEFKIICASICPHVPGKLAETPLQKKTNTQIHKKLLSGIVCRELAADKRVFMHVQLKLQRLNFVTLITKIISLNAGINWSLKCLNYQQKHQGHDFSILDATRMTK